MVGHGMTMGNHGSMTDDRSWHEPWFTKVWPWRVHDMSHGSSWNYRGMTHGSPYAHGAIIHGMTHGSPWHELGIAS